MKNLLVLLYLIGQGVPDNIKIHCLDHWFLDLAITHVLNVGGLGLLRSLWTMHSLSSKASHITDAC